MIIESVTSSVGSIVNLTQRNSILWGSGIMDKQTFFVKPHKTCAVRGPLTRKRFLKWGMNVLKSMETQPFNAKLF